MARNSRRDFLKTVAAGSVAATVFKPSATAAVQPPVSFGPSPVIVVLTINGQDLQFSVEPRVTLLDALRARSELTGTKRACDRGSCGACTVIVDGRTYYSCTMLAIEAQGRNIRTIEGLAQGDALHPVQQAFCDHDGMMCGFCTPGLVMATVALIEGNATPSSVQIKRALDGNLCRCGAHKGVLAAALDLKGGRRA